jgi:Glycosyltransferase family 10 (fucosyltransferase).
MKKVFIPKNTKIPLYKQFPTEQLVWGNYEFILGDSCDECDFVVVLDTLSKPLHVRCKEGGVICFPVEAASIKRYTNEYLHQFDTIFCFQDYLLKKPNAKFSIPPFPWMLIYDFYAMDDSVYDKYDYFKMPDLDNRLDKFCLFTSNKKFTKGHCDRVHFVEEITQIVPELVDVYGYGYNNVDVKYDVMSKYKYCIVIENERVPYWRTEKLSDAILAGCFPLYYGDPMIHEQFSDLEVEPFSIFDVKSVANRIKEIVSQDLYKERLEELNNARNKVLQKWNTFSIIANCLDKLEISDKEIRKTINPLRISGFDKYFYSLRGKYYSYLPYCLLR